MHQICKPLDLIIYSLWGEKLFIIGALIKVLFILTLLPVTQADWFVPFIVGWLDNPTSLPWSGHLETNGDPLAFPYGIVMFLLHLPTTAIGWFIDNIFATDYFSGLGFRISLFAADLLLLATLLQLFEKHWKKILIFYWLSPLVLFITYWHGQTDLVPVALFFYALALIKRRNFWFAGALLASSIAAKHSMLIGVPFVLLYLWSHTGVNRELHRFALSFILTLLVIQFPFILSDAFRIMVLDNREVDKLYWLFINMGDEKLIYLTPVIYLLLLYFFWRIKKINFDLLLAAMGVAFSILILMVPSPPGWFLWLVPIFTLHQSRYGVSAVTLIGVFSLLYIFYHLFHTSGSEIIFFDYSLPSIPFFSDPFIKSIHYTLIAASSLLIVIQILREGIRENDYYRLNNKPLVIGIAGDSGVGKTSLTKALANVFGAKALVEVSGDDYHNWDRKSPMWKTQTHLNPKANRLFELVRDVQGLVNGKVIRARQYDHNTGNFTQQKIRKNKEVILVEGLHTLYPQQLLKELDVSFYMEMDESLRTLLRLKRDVKERGRSKEDVLSMIANRKEDSDKYISPQANRAGVVFSLLPINRELLMDGEISDSNIKLRACIRNGIYYQELAKVLIGVCGLQVNLDSVDETGEVVIEVSGDVAADDIQLALEKLLPNMEELLDFSAKFSPNIYGIMQIITFMEIEEALKSRR